MLLQIAESIRKLRIQNHYTQEQLAEICGVSRQAVNKWEAGINQPDIEKIVQISQFFHVSIDEFIFGDSSSKPDNSSQAKENAADKQLAKILNNEKIVNQALKIAYFNTDVEEGILQFISFIGEKIGCSRMFIFEAKTEGSSYQNTYEWCAAGVDSQKQFLQNIPAEDLAEWIHKFSSNEYISVENVDREADNNPVVYRWLKPQGIHSMLAYPMFTGRAFLGVDNPAPLFIPQMLYLFTIMRQFLENMMQHRDFLREMKSMVKKYDKSKHNSKGLFYQLNVITGQFNYDFRRARELGYYEKITSFKQLEAVLSYHPECHDAVMLDGFQQVIKTKKNLCVEFLAYKKDGYIRWNRMSISPFLDSFGNVLQIYGFLQDISDEHQIVEQYNKYMGHLSAGLHICYLSRPIHLAYASDELCEFLGYSRKEFEKFVGDKYTNLIAEEDRSIFSSYAWCLANTPGIDSCEYRLRRKDGSFVTVIDTMESIVDSNGIMHGYAYILDKAELQVLLEKAEKNEKSHLELIDRQSELFAALGKDYTDVSRVWLDEDKLQVIKVDGNIIYRKNQEKVEYNPYYISCKKYIENYVAEEDKAKMLRAMYPDTVREAFARNDEYSLVYRVFEQGETHFYECKYIRLREREDEKQINFVAGFKNIDKIMATEYEQKKLIQKILGISKAVLQMFTSGYYIDFISDTFWELSNDNGDISKILGKSGKISEALKRWRAYAHDKATVKFIGDFFNQEILQSRLKRREYLTSKFATNDGRWFEMFILVMEYNEQREIAQCIFLFKDITKEKHKAEH